jgi:hypothetical protein
VIERERLQEAATRILVENGNQWPWEVVGVFPASDDDGPQWWNSFCYTVGLNEFFELWVPCQSIEGRYAGNALVAEMLNLIAAGIQEGGVVPGDTVRFPLGVPDGDDVDTFWWLSDNLDSSRRRQVNMPPAARACLPILWTSGLGWPE